MNSTTKKAEIELKEKLITFLFFIPVLGLLFVFKNSVGLTGITMFFLGTLVSDRLPYSKEREAKIREDVLTLSIPVWLVILLAYFLPL